ncbi:MAG: NAD(P)/FAD-dependent oxidoreductase [Candidatus Omnitrophota bacterium]
MKIYDIIIVGAGPAGIMAAIHSGQLGKDVLLLEKNRRLGQKLLISGKGRCNLTNIGTLDNFLDNFSKTGQFLRSAFSAFFNNDLVRFFEDKGLKLKAERGGRVFPMTDKANSVLKVLKSYLEENNVKIIYNKKVVNIGKNNRFVVKLDDQAMFFAKRLILATGGKSYPLTGSTGDGFKFACDLGHKIVDLRPGLVPLEAAQDWIKDLQGLSLKNVRIKFSHGKKQIESEIGEMIFTHFGVSGPLVLELSGQVTEWPSGQVRMCIDLKPGLTSEQLDKRLMRDFKNQGAKNYKNVLAELLPKKLIACFVRLSGIAADKKANQITNQDRRMVLNLLKSFSLTITKSRPIEEAIITRGGVSTREIDPRTMQSRKIRGLYFCGEIVDVDAVSGGYNLQAAFSTGYLAGQEASRSIN